MMRLALALRSRAGLAAHSFVAFSLRGGSPVLAQSDEPSCSVRTENTVHADNGPLGIHRER